MKQYYRIPESTRGRKGYEGDFELIGIFHGNRALLKFPGRGFPEWPGTNYIRASSLLKEIILSYYGSEENIPQDALFGQCDIERCEPVPIFEALMNELEGELR